jgi:uracil phosphoribosyltransferase
MSILYLDKEKNKEADMLIAVCKSDSQKHGIELRSAHYKLGGMLAKQMAEDLNAVEITVIIMMRAGLCFGMGVADELDRNGIKTSVLFYHGNTQWEKERCNCQQALHNHILIIDAVINTGNSIMEFAETLSNNQNIFFVANVISEKAVETFKNKNVYTVRSSHTSFIGSKIDIVKNNKGPDTGDRLFNTK